MFLFGLARTNRRFSKILFLFPLQELPYLRRFLWNHPPITYRVEVFVDSEQGDLVDLVLFVGCIRDPDERPLLFLVSLALGDPFASRKRRLKRVDLDGAAFDDLRRRVVRIAAIEPDWNTPDAEHEV